MIATHTARIMYKKKYMTKSYMTVIVLVSATISTYVTITRSK
jgi:hypothetical protein